MSFMCTRDGGEVQEFDSEAEAVAWGRERESFEVYGPDDRIVYQEFPEPSWR